MNFDLNSVHSRDIFVLLGIKMTSSNSAGPSSDEVAEEVRSIISKVVDDIGKGPAVRQLMIGGAAGW